MNSFKRPLFSIEDPSTPSSVTTKWKNSFEGGCCEPNEEREGVQVIKIEVINNTIKSKNNTIIFFRRQFILAMELEWRGVMYSAFIHKGKMFSLAPRDFFF